MHGKEGGIARFFHMPICCATRRVSRTERECNMLHVACYKRDPATLFFSCHPFSFSSLLLLQPLAPTFFTFKKAMSTAAERIATPTNYDEVVCFRPPPPPYEKVANGSSSSSSSSSSGMLSKVMSVWRRQAMAEQQGKLSGQAMMVDKKQVEHAVTLINIATEMDHSGNHQMAVDLYMMGLDRMLSAFPCKS